MFREIDELLLSSKFFKQKGYWLNKLVGIAEVERTELLFKSERKRSAEKEKGKVEILIPGELYERLMKLGKQSDLSIYIILLAVLKLLIHRYTGREDVTVVSPLFHRNIGEETLNDRVYIRDSIAGEAPFTDLLLAVRKSVLDAYEQQDYPAGKLMEHLFETHGENRTWGSEPLTDVGCLLSNIHGSNIKIIERMQDNEQLIFSFHRKVDNIDGHILYNRDVYDDGYVRLASQHFTRLLDHCLRDVKRKISSIFFPLAEEEKQWVVDFNRTRKEYPEEKTLVELFEEQVNRTPDSVAVVGSWRLAVGKEKIHITYGVLNEKAGQLAGLLREKGVLANNIVGIMMKRSVEIIIGIMGILKAGGAFLPIDPASPRERIDYMLKDSGAKILLKNLPEGRHFHHSSLIDHHSGSFAYVIYTSGTSGRPKGVMISHRAIVNYIRWAAQTYVRGKSAAFPFYTSISFDLTLTSLFTPLVTGNTVVVYGEEEKALLIDRIIKDNRVGVVKLTPSHLKLLTHRDEQVYASASNPRSFIVGGENLEGNLAVEIHNRFGGRIEIYNEYGPTEAAVACMIYRFDARKDRGGSVPIGRPIDNMGIYILDRWQRPAPFGAAGELCIAGVGLAAGYLNNPELTAAKFFDYRSYRTYRTYISSKKIYRTGDLALRLPDGNIEFLGRLDKQVKIRGYRVEPAEIENCLLMHGKVKAVVVTVVEMGDEDKCLCAYFVSDEELEVSGLKEYLSGELPDYMIPSYFVRIEKIPLTLNGKVDTKALPPPEFKLTPDYIPPRDILEEKLVEIWAEVLGVNRGVIGIDANFFELGGQSLKATILGAKIHKVLDIEVPLTEIFNRPTIRGMGEYIRDTGTANAAGFKFSSILPMEEKEYYAVTSVQRRLFFLQHLEPTNMSYNMPYFIAVEGDYDLEKLEGVFERLVKRHESFRTSFELLNGEPMQRVHEEADFKAEKHDARGMKPDTHTHIIDKFLRPFDLSNAPLLRVGFIIRDNRHMILMIDMHHIVSDGISQSIMESDFMVYYGGRTLPPLHLQYKDFAGWLNSEEQQERIRRQGDYWVKRFAGEIPLLELPVDFERPLAQTFEGKMIFFDTGAAMGNTLRALAADVGGTLYMVVLAVFNVMTARLGGQEDIIIGTSLAGRNHSDLQGIMGMFINALALRNYPSPSKAFRDFLQEVKQNTMDDFANQDYPFEDLVDKVLDERIPGRSPLFDVMMVLNNEEYPEFKLPGLKLSPLSYEKASAQMDLKLRLMESGENIVGSFEYSSRLFSEKTMARFVDYFRTIAASVVKDPHTRIGRIEMIPEEEKHRLLEEFNDTARSYPAGKTIHHRFEEQTAKTPGNTAAASAPPVTYRELNGKANRLARLLRKRGVKSESVVGIMMERSPEAICGMLAILKAGGAYLPIGTGLSRERVRYMLENSAAAILLSNSKAVNEISFTALQNFDSGDDVKIVMTPPRGHIEEFDRLPMPDRSLVNLANYKDRINMASVTRGISLQATRGCPYECLFCHKVWSKNHVYRSAENIYNEVEYYYRKGVVNFSIIDDCFNLHRENSRRFFQLVIKNKLNLQLFFPNGLRGDILTGDYIDLMVEAGTRGINLSLETASPRLQKVIKKNLDIDKFKRNIDYIAGEYPGVILELATMHGFPTETEEEAMMTLDFIKGVEWLHFPYIHILKIYPNTEMEALALEHGISREDILASRDLAYHELPETLPFPKSFTRKYQSDFMNNYFLRKERLKQVLPIQAEILGEAAMVRKYNSYLPAEINCLEDIFKLAHMEPAEVEISSRSNPAVSIPTIFEGAEPRHEEPPSPGSRRILLLDLSQHFSSSEMLYNVVEQPLGLISLLTYARQQLGDKISGRIYKSGNDFDSFAELRALVTDYRPDLVGIRTLTYYREFFHETVSLLRQWGMDVPIIAGGPYATSDYHSILKDRNVNLVVYGEGEYSFVELLEKMLENDFKLPGEDVLRGIAGLVFPRAAGREDRSLEVVLPDVMAELIEKEESGSPGPFSSDENLAYVMYTSGSTGKPKGVMVEHRQVNNCIRWMQEKFNLDETAVVAQRTNLTFDPSVWEIFWPLAVGAGIKIINDEDRRDVDYLTRLLSGNSLLTVMYCPSTLVTALAHYLEMKEEKPRLKLPWLIIGAEPVTMEVVKTFYSYFEGRIVNTYGPTEGTINNTYYDLEPGDERAIVPIGKPVANNRVYILSGSMGLVPIGVSGEICIGGAGVARGYINDREKTLINFTVDPFGGERLYKTGDIGRWLADGNIEIMGRQDEQVKIRGHRIEPAEIEAALLRHPCVREAVVVAKTGEELKEQTRECKTCGIWSNYPGIRINDENVCNVCENLSLYKQLISRYFKTPEDLALKIREGSRERKSRYDCVLVYACERVATYALYKLLEMGFKVLTVTYDSGHYEQASLDRIKRITREIGVDHIFLRHKNSDGILRESLKVAKTMCKGCIHTSTSLAGEYAYRNNIKFVIGETLSRGQIVENKLFKFLEMGIHEVDEIEREVSKLMRHVAALDKNIFDIIDIDIVKDGSLYDKVEFIDFYRYFDVSNAEMAAYLDEKDVYWKSLETRAAYSTDCKICQVGDYNHFKELGYHYTGSARSWEKRLGHATVKEVKDDLRLTLSAEEHAGFLRKIGYKEEMPVDKSRKHLCAYFTAAGEVEVSQLREYLAGQLPEYMVPSYFVSLERIPLTANGKIDRKALPAPGLGSEGSGNYAAPGTDVEEKLKEVWQEVLGVDGIGVNDDLFKLGGDSIKAIRIVSKLQRYRLKLEIKDLFLNPTIRKAAGCVRGIDRQIPQEPAAGELPLTPIQHWFFENNFTPRHHFNQSVMLYTREGFNGEYVKEVFTRILEHHDALRMVFKGGEMKGDVIQFNRPVEPPLFDLEVIDLKDIREPGIEGVVLEHAQRLQRSIDLASGPLVKLGLFKTGPGRGDHLLIIIHHLVMDGISWRIVLEDFEVGYAQVREGMEIEFQDKTNSFKYWSEKLSAYSRTEEALKELDYWKKIEESVRDVPGLPADYPIPSAQRKLADIESIMMTLNEDETGKLLKDVHKAFNTEINDVLLTGLALAVKEWTGLEKVAIKLEGHGREPIMEDVDISRTVGWFTTQFPVLLDISKENELSGQIKAVKETLRQIPHRGIGYGILRHLTPDTRFGLEPEIVFNYMGQFGGGGPGLTPSPLPKGDDRSPEMIAECTIMINGGIADGKLGLSFAYNKKELKKESIEALVDGYESHLTRIIEYCGGVEETEMTPGDFAAKNLDSDEMDAIYNELGLE